MEDAASFILDAIEDPNFSTLLRCSQRRAMTWDMFLQYPLPPNMSPLSVWKVLGSFGRSTGVCLYPDANGLPYWYRRTDDLVSLVETIEHRCRRGFAAGDEASYRFDQNFLIGLRIEECCAAARIGGFAFDRETLEMYVRSSMLPEGNLERVLANMVAIDTDLPSYIDRPFSNGLFDDLRERLLDGVGEERFAALQPASDEPVDEKSWSALAHQVECLYAYGNREVDEPVDFMVLRGNVLADSMRHHKPFGPISALLGSLASRLFYLKNDLSILAIIPISATKAQWLFEGLPSAQAFCTLAEYESTLRRSPHDLTVHQMLSAHCIMSALDEIEAKLEDDSLKDISIHEVLCAYPQFNSRQRSILARAIRSPQAEFSIRFHQKKHRIAYATARRDLVELEQAGFLRIEQRGKVFVFKRDARLGELASTA